MEEIYQTKFQIKVVKMFEGWWSIGINLSHDEFETYIHINFFKWAISIGKLVYNEPSKYDIDIVEWSEKFNEVKEDNK